MTSNFTTKLLLSVFALGGMLMTSSSVYAQDETTSQQETQKRTDYKFRMKETPVKLSPYNTVVFLQFPQSVATMRGDNIVDLNHGIVNMAVSPAGSSFGYVDVDKKGRHSMALYSTIDAENKIADFDRKKYGEPSCLVFTPDARKVLVATNSGLYVFEARKMILVDQMELPFIPTQMCMSDNGYYLTIAEGDRVVVYNFEEKKVRRDWNYGEKVNDITFSNGSGEFAVLTEDGILSVYDTRSFNIKHTIDDLGSGLACAFNNDGKYIVVATSPETLEVINLVRASDRNTMPVDGGGVGDLKFIKDSDGNSLLVYTATNALMAKRMVDLEPHFAQLISDEVDQMMAEWQKMMPGESMEDYRARVSEENRNKQRRLFEDEISTRLAGDLLAGQKMSLGSYDRANQALALSFESMPTIWLPVPEDDVTNFKTADDLLLSEVQYGVLPDDTFEIVYAKVFNKADGKTYEYNNHDRVAMDFMGGGSNVVSLEVLQQQQMEVMKLNELREKVVEEARNDKVISNNTNIAVDSKVVPSYNANGDEILNYEVNFTYQVDPEFSATEDFPPGKYLVDESGAASSMLKIVKEAFEGDFAQYLKKGKKLKVTISGTADATPIIRTIPYNGVYGDFVDEPIYENGDLTTITVTKADGVKENRQLAFLRAEGVKSYLNDNISRLSEMDTDYVFNIDVAQGKGSEFRRITANFTFVDVF